MDMTQLGYKADNLNDNDWLGFDSRGISNVLCKILDDINSLFLSFVN
jgi:hypothetical protein